MEIVHHFGIKLSCDNERQDFSSIGIDLEPGARVRDGVIITSFEISEHDPHWIEAKRLAARFQITETIRTEFAQSEIDEANAICILASSHRGYPEPSEKRGYLAATYDLSDYCNMCGIGRRQISPFRMKSAPALGHSILQLNWIFDEYFVAREVWSTVFQSFGIGYWPVVLDKTGQEIPSVVQLRISEYADLDIKPSTPTSCSVCGRAKLNMDLRGFCPEPTGIPAPIFKSTQYFGTDGAAFNKVLIVPRLYQEIKRNSLRGIEFYPCGGTK